MDDCLKVEHGDDVMNKIERIRALATSYNTLSTLEPEPARKAEATDEVRDAKDVEPHPVDSNTIGDLSDALRDRLLHELTTLELEDAITVTRSCGHYLNLSSIAETHHRVRNDHTRSDK